MHGADDDDAREGCEETSHVWLASCPLVWYIHGSPAICRRNSTGRLAMTKCNCGAEHYSEPYHAVWCRKAGRS